MAELSIVIPCFNAAHYINRCVESLKAQSYKDFEVYLVDDCSEDNTWNVLQELKAESGLNIHTYRNEVNSGPAVSRNKGIDAATSKYITFCDADDWYDSNFLELMHNTIVEHSVDIAFCGYKVVDETGKSDTRPVAAETKVLTKEEAFGLEADSLCMLMVKTEIMKRTKLPNLRNGEDVATVPLLMINSKSYAVTSECPYNYFRRSDSASERPTMKLIENLVASFEYTKQMIPEVHREELEYLGVKNLLYATVINLFSMGYNVKKAKSIVSSFEKDFPQWSNNKYNSNLRSYKRLVVKLIKYRLYPIIWILAFVRLKLIK